MTPVLAADSQGEFGRPGRVWRRPDFVAWALLVSLGLHLAAGLVIAWQRQIAAPTLQESVPIDFVTPEEFEAETGKSGAAAPENRTAPRPAGPALIHATAMLSQAALADPKSRQARAMLPHLDPTERSVQLCNLEAMEQVHAWKPSLQPERIVAYAMADLAIAANGIRADGAAFLSGGEWYTMRFACGLSQDHARVVSFDFTVGGTIPHDQWDRHSLPTAN
jgi:hypothetical protein